MFLLKEVPTIMDNGLEPQNILVDVEFSNFNAEELMRIKLMISFKFFLQMDIKCNAIK